MSRFTPLSLLTLAATLNFARAQTPASTSLEPLSSKRFTWPNIPYQVTGDQGGIRGPQAGFNLCNSTTENQQSLCQTLFMNNIFDFCIWSSNLNGSDTIAEGEAREVAWCSQPGHGTRIIPPGAITGAQFLYTPDYLQLVGFIDQTKVGLTADDEGGELDPHGADEQGNPLGGIVFTNGFGQNAAAFDAQLKSTSPAGPQNYTQVIEWVEFIGSGVFCLKMCNPSGPNAAELCAHVYDEIGCTYNAIANYNAINGSYTVCDSDDMAPPGIFTDSTGHLTTWFQPFTPLTTIPYTTSIPPSSNCHTYQSTQLFSAAAALPTFSSSAKASSATGTSRPASSGASGSSSRSGSQPSATGTTSGAVGGPLAYIAVGLLTTFSATLVTMFSML